MYGEAKKLHLIEAILKIENDAVLMEVESVIEKSKLDVVPLNRSFTKLAGALSNAEADAFEKAINEGCENIHSDDWK
jgi:hypothetical protein